MTRRRVLEIRRTMVGVIALLFAATNRLRVLLRTSAATLAAIAGVVGRPYRFMSAWWGRPSSSSSACRTPRGVCMVLNCHAARVRQPREAARSHPHREF